MVHDFPDFIERIDDFVHLKIVHLRGHLDFEVMPEVTRYVERQKGTRAALDRKSVILDLRKVQSVNTATIAQLIKVLADLKKKNFKLGLMNVPDSLREMILILNLKDILTVFESRKTALEEIHRWSDHW